MDLTLLSFGMFDCGVPKSTNLFEWYFGHKRIYGVFKADNEGSFDSIINLK